jgi:formate-dependent nitrite reductase cytochrome c552 subunit
MKIPKIESLKNIPKVPLIIGGIFAVSLLIVLATTIALRKTELKFKVTQLEGKFKDRVGATFVGSQTCKKCHERTYLEWKTSLHSRMMRDAKADPSANIGDFDSPSDVRAFTREEVDFTLGSQWKQQYLKREGDDLIVFPAQYNVYTGEWKDYYPDEPAKRDWFTSCAGCHATGVDPEKKTFVEMGIACEACHGPGSNHVRAVPGYEIPTIIQASRLTPALAAQICGSCHTGGRDKTGRYAYPVAYQTHKGEGNIRLYFDEFTSNDHSERFWPSGESRHSNQQYLDWKKSEHSKVGVTCITCHDVHRSRSALQAVGEVPNPLVVIRSKTRLFEDQLCKACHTTVWYRSVHRIHTFGSCIRCHMPKVTKIGEAGDAHSHTFRFMFPQATLDAGSFDKQPNACNSCHHHTNTPTEALVGFLEAAKKNDMPRPLAVHKKPGETLAPTR